MTTMLLMCSRYLVILRDVWGLVQTCHLIQENNGVHNSFKLVLAETTYYRFTRHGDGSKAVAFSKLCGQGFQKREDLL